MSNIEERIMETVEDYMTTPCHKYAHRLISLYSIYTEKTPPQNNIYQNIKKHYDLVMKHNQNRTDGI